MRNGIAVKNPVNTDTDDIGHNLNFVKIQHQSCQRKGIDKFLLKRVSKVLLTRENQRCITVESSDDNKTPLEFLLKKCHAGFKNETA